MVLGFSGALAYITWAFLRVSLELSNWKLP